MLRRQARDDNRLLLAEGVDADDLGSSRRAGLGDLCGRKLSRRLVGGRRTLRALLGLRPARRARLFLGTRALQRGGRLEWLAGPGVSVRGLAARGAELVRAPTLAVGLLELQAVGHARVEEHLDGGEGNSETLRDAVKGEFDLKAVVADDQVPKAMLQDDRHLLGVLR